MLAPTRVSDEIIDQNLATQSHGISLATLSMAAEHAAMQGIIPPEQDDQVIISTNHDNRLPFPETEALGSRSMDPTYGFDFEDTLDSLATFLDNGPVASHHFPSFISAEQPIPFFSPGSASNGNDTIHQGYQPRENLTASAPEQSGSFSRFGSRLPSLQPEESPGQREQNSSASKKPISDVSFEDRQVLASKLKEFAGVVPSDFQLPSRLALSRYLAGYINGFHEHMPCLHIPTMSVQNTSIELLLAMAAVGAQYCFEGEKGVELFHTSQEIAMRRIRRRDVRTADADAEQPQGGNFGWFLEDGGLDSPRQSLHVQPSHLNGPSSGLLGLPIDQGHGEDLMQTAQALFLLMAMATWAKHQGILRQALAIQSILATLIREDGLKMAPVVNNDLAWEDWAHYESIKRTKFIVFCFFNLHCIVYNIPSLILSSELDLPLPCDANEFRAPSAVRWREARKKNRRPEANFQSAFNSLFDRSSRVSLESYLRISSLGNYVLIHALIQRIFFIRQIAGYPTPSQPSASVQQNEQNQDKDEETSYLEQALRNWQLGWKQNPESSLDPWDPNGPIAFNSTALLRLAYIRLNNIFIGPAHHTLASRDPNRIADSFRESSPTKIRRTRKLVRAVLHSAHALSIPVKIGIRLVARTQSFTWSIQHSICSLECAFLLCKWLEALALANPETEISDDEKRICWLVKTMLDETEYGVKCGDETALQSPTLLRQLSAGVLRVWAQIFKGAQTWAIVDIIGTALNTYADMLENS
uniref:Regulatory protein GAL4 n=2 Tax=Talaromyces marneffei PM1 TaxID=1077442 RepID=A0A093UME3_TALMA